MKVLMLDDRDTIFRELPKSTNPKRDLLRESVIAVGKPKQLLKLLEDLKGSFWYRLFLCHEGCPEEVVRELAKEADSWKPEFKIVRSSPSSSKVSRREFLLFGLKNTLKLVPSSVPTLQGPCASPECSLCKQVCPTNAIKRKERRVVVDPDSCISCGLCVIACPFLSLSMPGLDPNLLVRALTKFINHDMRIKVVWREPQSVSENDFKDNTLVLLGLEKEFSFIRDFFTKVLGWDFTCCGKEWKGEKVEPLDCPYTPKGPLSPASVIKIKYALPPFFKVKVKEGLCTVCNACSIACPTGALKLESEGIYLSLKFNPVACLGCNLCEYSCPVEKEINELLGIKAKVIKVEPSSDVRCGFETLVKKHSISVQCPYCGSPIDVTLDELKELVNKYLLSRQWDEVYSADEFLEMVKPLVEKLLCEKCKRAFEEGMLMPDEVAKAIISYIGCLHEQTRGQLFERDPVEGLRPLMFNMGMFVTSYCAYWNQYFKFRHQFLPPGYLNKGQGVGAPGKGDGWNSGGLGL